MTTISGNQSPVRGRPLYVLGSKEYLIDLDGPSLVVRSRGAATARYPLARVSRVVSAGSANWNSRALYACLEQGIPVVFTDRAGDPTGYLQPTVHAASSLNEALEELLTRADWREHYGTWLRAERMRAVREWRKAKAARGEPVEPGELREIVRLYVYDGRPADPTGREYGVYGAAIMALACEQLRHAGVRHHYAGFGGSDLDLAGDLHRLLVCALELELQGLGTSVDVTGDVVLRIVHTYASMLIERPRGILGRLHRRAAEIVQG